MSTTIEYLIKTSRPESTKTDCMIVFACKNKLLPCSLALDNSQKKIISKTLSRGNLLHKLGKSLFLADFPSKHIKQLLVVSVGEEHKLISADDVIKLLKSIFCSVYDLNLSNIAICIDDICTNTQKDDWLIRQLIDTFEYKIYSFDGYKTRTAKTPQKSVLKKVILLSNNTTKTSTANTGLQEGCALAVGRSLARTLSNLPANICTPSYLADYAQFLARQHKNLKTKVLKEKEMSELGMGAFLSVSRGSKQEARFIIMEYKNGKKSLKPILLIGKGITFDSGGISLKPAAKMDEMKYDMCGAASVMGTIQALIKLDLPINVVAIIAASENMPGSQASRPGDIVTSMSGQTIEILNTDAEGRLVLCDALTYAERYKPKAVIDVATLTGACIVALGHYRSAVAGNNDALIKQLIEAGKISNDLVWQLPIDKAYQKQLKSNFADMANIGGMPAGTITAACFLSRFAEKYPWAHLDIAGIAWVSGEKKGATGRPVPLLVQYLLQQAN